MDTQILTANHIALHAVSDKWVTYITSKGVRFYTKPDSEHDKVLRDLSKVSCVVIKYYPDYSAWYILSVMTIEDMTKLDNIIRELSTR